MSVDSMKSEILVVKAGKGQKATLQEQQISEEVFDHRAEHREPLCFKERFKSVRQQIYRSGEGADTYHDQLVW